MGQRVGRVRWPKITRDGILFVGGLGALYHELVLKDAERPMILMLVAGMLGLPVFLNKDEKSSAEQKKPSPLVTPKKWWEQQP